MYVLMAVRFGFIRCPANTHIDIVNAKYFQNTRSASCPLLLRECHRDVMFEIFINSVAPVLATPERGNGVEVVGSRSVLELRVHLYSHLAKNHLQEVATSAAVVPEERPRKPLHKAPKWSSSGKRRSSVDGPVQVEAKRERVLRARIDFACMVQEPFGAEVVDLQETRAKVLQERCRDFFVFFGASGHVPAEQPRENANRGYGGVVARVWRIDPRISMVFQGAHRGQVDFVEIEIQNVLELIYAVLALFQDVFDLDGVLT